MEKNDSFVQERDPSQFLFMLVPLVEYIFLTTLHKTISSSSYIALQPIVVTMVTWGHHAPAYGPVGQALLRVPFQDVSLLHGLP